MKKGFYGLAMLVSVFLLVSCATAGAAGMNDDETFDVLGLKDRTQLDKHFSDMDALVQLSLPNMPIPMTTAITMNSHGPISIKSTDGSGFEVLDCRITFTKEALADDGKVLKEYITYYKPRSYVINSLNGLSKKGEIDFERFLRSLKESDLYSVSDGDARQPDTNSFAVLRSREIYNFTVLDAAGKTYAIQIFIETMEESGNL